MNKNTGGKTIISLNRYFQKTSIFDHQTEHQFYEILRDEILGSRYVAFVQIPLSAIIGVRNKEAKGWMGHFGKIAQKRVDFVICNKENLEPLVAIELDGSSHKIRSRIERDIFVEALFKTIGFPLVRIDVRKLRDRKFVTLQIANALGLKRKKGK